MLGFCSSAPISAYDGQRVHRGALIAAMFSLTALYISSSIGWLIVVTIFRPPVSSVATGTPSPPSLTGAVSSL